MQLADSKAEYGMHSCGAARTQITKEGVHKIREGEDIIPERSRFARRSIAILSRFAQDRPDLSFVTRVRAQKMSKPLEGAYIGIKQVVRY